MTRSLVAGVDSSTQSCKIVVCDAETGQVVRSARAPHPDGTEVDPAAWWAAWQQASSGGLLDGVEAIAVGGQQHGMVTLDDADQVVRPALLWNDTRSAGAAADLVEEFGGAQAWAEEIGIVPVAAITATKLRWLARNEPDNMARTRTCVLPHDWVTGQILKDGNGFQQWVTDRGDASGTGCDEGIVASEAANNATVGGALIPLIALGIPGSVIDAVLLGAFVIHGLQPGPLLFKNHPETVHMISGSFFVANGVMFVMMILTARGLVRLSRVPLAWLAPPVIVFCIVGSYALANRMFDVWVMIGFGIFGFIMNRLRLPLAPFVIGFVLAPLAEENLSAGLVASGGSWAPLVTRPFALICVLIAVVAAGISIRRAARMPD